MTATMIMTLVMIMIITASNSNNNHNSHDNEGADSNTLYDYFQSHLSTLIAPHAEAQNLAA